MLLTSTKNTPYINLDLNEGNFVIKGRSVPEKSLEFYQPVIDHIKENGVGIKQMNIEVNMEYFNTSSCKCLINVFKEFKELSDQGCELNVSWYAEEEDVDMIEAGEDFQDLLDIDFKYLGYTTEDKNSKEPEDVESILQEEQKFEFVKPKPAKRNFWSFFEKLNRA